MFNTPLDRLHIIEEMVLQAITCTGIDNKKSELMLMRRATASV